MRDKLKEKKAEPIKPSVEVSADPVEVPEVLIVAEKLGYHFVARNQFRDYKKGSQIIDANEIKQIEGCHELNMVVRVLD